MGYYSGTIPACARLAETHTGSLRPCGWVETVRDTGGDYGRIRGPQRDPAPVPAVGRRKGGA